MKTILVLTVMLFASVSLSAQDSNKELILSFTNIEVFNKEVVPALNIDLKPESLDGFDFVFAYVDEFFIKKNMQLPSEIENPQMQNIYIALNYRF